LDYIDSINVKRISRDNKLKYRKTLSLFLFNIILLLGFLEYNFIK